VSRRKIKTHKPPPDGVFGVVAVDVGRKSITMGTLPRGEPPDAWSAGFGDDEPEIVRFTHVCDLEFP